MLVAYWIVAGVLALGNLFFGGSKLVQSKKKFVASGMGWAEAFPAWGVKLIGLLEVLGAVGLILPPLTGIAPMLAPWAAIGLVLVQAGAAITHLSRREAKMLSVNTPLMLLAVVAAWLGFAVWA